MQANSPQLRTWNEWFVTNIVIAIFPIIDIILVSVTRLKFSKSASYLTTKTVIPNYLFDNLPFGLNKLKLTFTYYWVLTVCFKAPKAQQYKT